MTVYVGYVKQLTADVRIEYYEDTMDSAGYMGSGYDETVTGQAYGSTYTVPTTLRDKNIQTGYEFNSTDPTSGSITIGAGANVIKVLYVKRSDLSYDVEYYYDGAIDSTKTDTFSNQIFGTVVSTYTDKVIDGYRLDSDTAPITIGAGANVIKVLYVKRSDLSYDVEYYYDGAIDSTKTDTFSNQIFGTVVSTYTDKVIDGYRLDSDTAPITIGAGANVIKVYYVAKKYKVTWNAGAGTFGTTNNVSKDNVLWNEDNLFPPSPPTRTGYSLEGWRVQFDGVTLYTDTNNPNMVEAITKYGDIANNDEIPEIILAAIWKQNPDVTINYEAKTGGNVSLASETLAPSTGVAQGSTATAEAGYHFVNWTNENGNVVGTNAKFVPAKVNGLNVAATYYANFEEDDDITINYEAKTGGSVSLASETLAPATGIAQGSTATAAIGYTFENWTDESGAVVSTNATFIPAKVNGLNVAATYYANFEIDALQIYTIDYVATAGGSVSPADESHWINYTGDNTGSTATPSDGYRFVEWTDESGATVSTNANYVPTIHADATFTAHFEKRDDLSYKVEYYYDGTIDDAKTDTFNNQMFGTVISTYDDKVIDGYEFESDTAPITISTGENVIEVYYVKKADFTFDKEWIDAGWANRPAEIYVTLSGNDFGVSGEISLGSGTIGNYPYVANLTNDDIWQIIIINLPNYGVPYSVTETVPTEYTVSYTENGYASNKGTITNTRKPQGDIDITITKILGITDEYYATPTNLSKSESALVCGIDVHEHDDSCYEDAQVSICGHVHGEDCYEWSENEDGEWESSDMPVNCAHTHDESCYESVKTLICGKPEHKHSIDSCYSSENYIKGTDYDLDEVKFYFTVSGAGEKDGTYDVTFSGAEIRYGASKIAATITIPQALYTDDGATVTITESGLPNGWTIDENTKTITINKYGDISGEGTVVNDVEYGPENAVFVNNYGVDTVPSIDITKNTTNARTGNRENAPADKMMDFSFTIEKGDFRKTVTIPASWFVGGTAGITVYLPELRGQSLDGLTVTENTSGFGDVWSAISREMYISENNKTVTFENQFKDDKYPAIIVRKVTNIETAELFKVQISGGAWSETLEIAAGGSITIDFKNYGSMPANYTGTLTLSEVIENKENWKYDSRVYSITVKDGEITSGSSSFTFANTYEEPAIIVETPKITISKTMTINTNRAEPETPTFEFELYDETNARAVGTFNITGSGSLTIDLGDYGYATATTVLTIKEVIPENLSYYWSYDARVYTVTLQSGEITGFACSDGSSVT
ncbi:MAG: hypothetical protein FWG34_12240, partial [Oscillospiraceae bacterium]|nr:hypothetical protein [Oscillospiraceae bacterium]